MIKIETAGAICKMVMEKRYIGPQYNYNTKAASVSKLIFFLNRIQSTYRYK
jgi:hypothetical protein